MKHFLIHVIQINTTISTTINNESFEMAGIAF